MLRDVAANRQVCWSVAGERRDPSSGFRFRGSLADASHVIVAFSGGADSVLATHIVAALKKPMTIWYLHHYTTPVEAQRMAVFRETRERYPEAEFIEDQADVSRLAKRLGYSWEHTASLLRRKRLLRLRARVARSSVVTGHNYSDYLETLALRRERKLPESALPYLCPEDPDNGFVRPLFEISRDEVRGRADALGLGYYDDPSNDDLAFARNRLRAAPRRVADPRYGPPPYAPNFETPGKGRELRLSLAAWNALGKADKSRTVFSAFRRLAVARKFTRAHFARAHRLPFSLPPFYAESEKSAVVFRRGLGDDVSLTGSANACDLRGNFISRRFTIRQSIGNKSVAKIFSEMKLSLRERRHTLVYLQPGSAYRVARIIFPDGSERSARP